MNMKRLCALAGLSILLALAAGCSGGQNPTATTDPILIYTQVAQTVQAQMTKTGAASILTPKPTNTPAPTDVPPTTAPTQGTPNPTTSGTQATAAATQAATSAAGTPGTVVATTFTLPTSTGQAPTAPDKMLYVSQTVPDGTKVKANDQFTLSWVVKNVGTTTWDKSYRIRFFGGDRYGIQDQSLQTTVAPNASLTITVHVTAPGKAGQYNSIWVMTNKDGVNFGFFTFSLEVK